MSLLFKIGHNFASWQCLAICCQADTLETNWLEIWDFPISTIFSWFLTHQLSLFNFFFQASGMLLCQKTFYLKGDIETAYKDFFTLIPLQFHCTGIKSLGRNEKMSRDHILTDLNSLI